MIQCRSDENVDVGENEGASAQSVVIVIDGMIAGAVGTPSFISAYTLPTQHRPRNVQLKRSDGAVLDLKGALCCCRVLVSSIVPFAILQDVPGLVQTAVVTARIVNAIVVVTIKFFLVSISIITVPTGGCSIITAATAGPEQHLQRLPPDAQIPENDLPAPGRDGHIVPGDVGEEVAEVGREEIGQVGLEHGGGRRGGYGTAAITDTRYRTDSRKNWTVWTATYLIVATQ